MKKIQLIMFILLGQMLIVGYAQAQCNLEAFQFGSSYEEIQKKLGLSEAGLMPIIDGESKKVVFTPGEEVCKGEEAFIGTPVEFVFLYDNLVEIRTMRLSDKPVMIHWAESIYGKKDKKPRSFYSEKPNAQWLWNNFNATIAYSIQPDANDVIESIIIQSRRHQRYFEKYTKEEERLIQRSIQ